jgi:hypothetical protein
MPAAPRNTPKGRACIAQGLGFHHLRPAGPAVARLPEGAAKPGFVCD